MFFFLILILFLTVELLIMCLFLSLAAALMKLDPEDGEQIIEYLNTQALLTREKSCKNKGDREGQEAVHVLHSS